MPKGDSLLANTRRWDQLAGVLRSTFPLETIPLPDHVGDKATVLDYGCGEGRFFPRLARKYGHVIGCDTSRRMCHLAETMVGKASVEVLANPRSLPLQVPPFDAVVAVGVLSSIIPADERHALVSRLWNGLPDQGFMVLADFGRSAARSYLSRYQDPVLEAYTIRTAEGLLIHHFTMHELVNLVPTGGKLEVTRTVDAQTVHGNPIPGHVAVIRKNR